MNNRESVNLLTFNQWIFPDSNTLILFEEIKIFEEEIGLTLPEDYKSFLLNCKIGKLYYNNYLVKVGNSVQNFMVESFLNLDEVKNTYKNLEEFRSFNPESVGLFPIANTHASPVLCISLKENIGNILLIDWDLGITLQESCFFDFLKKITFDDEFPDWNDSLFKVI